MHYSLIVITEYKAIWEGEAWVTSRSRLIDADGFRYAWAANKEVALSLKEEMIMERWEIPTIQELNVEETAGGHYPDVMENECAHVNYAS